MVKNLKPQVFMSPRHAPGSSLPGSGFLRGIRLSGRNHSLSRMAVTASSALAWLLQANGSFRGHSRRKHGAFGQWLRTTKCRPCGPYGPVFAGSVEPKFATQGTCSAAAICIGPLSLVKRTLERASNAARLPKSVLPTRLTIPSNFAHSQTSCARACSSEVPNNQMRTSGRRWRTWQRTFAKNDGAQDLLSHREAQPTASSGPPSKGYCRMRSEAVFCHSCGRTRDASGISSAGAMPRVCRNALAR